MTPKGFEYTPLEDALRVLSQNVKATPRSEWVDVRNAFGRVLSDDVHAVEDLPPRDTSHFDGFAIRAEDVASASKDRPVVLKLVGRTPLAQVPKGVVKAGEAWQVFTGGLMPLGADAVVPVEDTELEGRSLTVRSPIPRGDHVYARGRDVRKGEKVMGQGRTLRAQDLTLLASLHVARVRVFSKPRVAIIPTGGELTPVISPRRGNMTVESHSIMLERLIEQAGGTPMKLPIIPDAREAIARSIRKALPRVDIVLVLAGTSLGEPDFSGAAVSTVGKPGILVHGIAVHRGRVMGFGAVRGKAVILLPGPVQGALNGFHLFAYPLIRTYLGKPMEKPPAVPATVAEDWVATAWKQFDQMVYVRLVPGEGILAFPESGETEKMSFLVTKDGYTVVPGTKGTLTKGETVLVHLLPGFSGIEA